MLKTINDEYLIAIGAAIREKNGTEETYKPSEMAEAILAITGSGGGDIEIPAITGNCERRFINDGWNWFIENYESQIRTENITKASSMFIFCRNLERIPFAINFTNNTYCSMDSMLQNCESLKEVPVLNNVYPETIANLFCRCHSLRYLPEDFGADWNWDRLHTYAYAGMGGVFQECQSLRRIPALFIENFWNTAASASSTPYYGGFQNCYNLDEVCNLIPLPKSFASNLFKNTFENCYCLKRITFAMNEDGTPKTAQWKNQTIDLTYGVGYCLFMLNYERDAYCKNSGRTIEKAIYNDETYAALKNDPDAFVAGYQAENPVDYSKYNHDSAVETINSLPDTSAYLATAGGTNTIKFTGAAGALTDAGAINTLTDAEIAVAAAKGWTVSLV